MRLKRVLKWTGITAAVLTVLLLIAALVLVMTLPGIVQRQIEAQLAEMGLGGSVRVSRVGLNSAALTDLQIGSDEHLTINSAEVSYTIGELRTGRVRTLMLSGVRLLIKVDAEGNVDIGALGKVQAGDADTKADASPLPFDRIVLRSSAIVINTPDRDIRVPINGSIERTDVGAFKFDLVSQLFDRDAQLSGRCTLGDGAIDIADARIALDSADVTLPGTGMVLGGARLDLRLDGTIGAADITLNIGAGSSLGLGTVYAPIGGLRIVSTASGEPWLGVEVGDEPVRVAIAGGDWSVTARSLAVTMRPTVVSMSDLGVVLRGLRGDLTLDADASELESVVALTSGSMIHVTDVRLPTQQAYIGPTRRSGDAPWLTFQVGADPTRLSIPAGGDGWTIDVADTDLTLGETDVVLPDAGVDLRRVTATLPMTAEIDAGVTLLRGGIGASLRIGDGRGLPGGIVTRQCTPPEGAAAEREEDAAWAEIDVVDEPIALTIAPYHWELGLARARLRVSPTDVSDDDGAPLAEAMTIETTLGLTTGPDTTTVRLHEPAAVTASRVTLPQLDGASIEAVALRIAPLEDVAGPQISYANNVLAARADVTATRPLAYVDGVLRVDLPRLAADVRVQHNPAPDTRISKLRYAVDVSTNEATVNHAGVDLSVDKIDLSLPIRSAGELLKAQTTGRFSTGAIGLAGETLPGVEGAARVIDERLRFDASWEAMKGVTAKVTGQVDARGVQIEAHVPPTDLTDASAVANRFGALQGIEITGRIAADATIAYADGVLTPHLQTTLDNVTLREKTTQLTASGIRGTVTFNGLAPLATPPAQRLRFSDFQIGEELKFTNGDVSFHVNTATDLFVERVRVRFGEKGWWTAHAIRYDHDRPTVATEFYIEEMNLGDWLSVLTGEKVTGTGQLYGRIPIVFRPDEGRKLLFGEGYLYAKSGKGHITFKDAAMVGQLLESADPRFRSDENFQRVRDRVVEALANFEYSMFRFDLLEKDGDVTLKLETRGQGAEGQKQELGSFVVNWNNFERNVNTYLFRKVPPERDEDRAGRSLDRFFAPIER